jgi:hypothetical protein
MRRLLLLAGLLVPLLLPTPVLAGTCPALEGGVVDKDAYRLGELIDFYGTYHDFADPGTVTISWERTTDGATREYTAANSPDGSWYLRLTLDSPQDVGRWTVTVVVSQTDALDTCTDSVTIGLAAMPRTATEDPPDDASEAPWTVPLLAGLIAGWLALRRRQSPLPLP